MSDDGAMDDVEILPLDLIITFGDCEFYAHCACGVSLGRPIKVNQSLDLFQEPWERHSMTSCTGVKATA